MSSWATASSLKINSNKTKAVLFRPKSSVWQIDIPLKLDRSTIQVVPTVKILGVFFNQYMSWNEHVEHVMSKVSKITGIIYKHRFCLPERVKIILYNTLFASHLKYCQLVWGNTTKLNLDRLHIAQKKILRLVANVPYGSHADILFSKFKVTSIFDLYTQTLIKKYKDSIYYNNKSFLSLASLEENSSFYHTRSPEHWRVSHPRTNYGFQMLQYTVPSTINELIKKIFT